MTQSLISPVELSKFIGPADPEWTRFLGNTQHDFYHLPSYARMSSNYEPSTPVAFYAELGESSLLLPLLIRPLPEDLGFPKTWCDAASPYGYPGPLMQNAADPEAVRLLLRTFRTYALENNIISAFVRMHPFLNDTPQVFSELGKVVQHGDTVYVDLRKSLDEIWRELRHDHRKHIRKLRRLGFTVEFDSWSRMHDFIDIYQVTMERVAASDFYRFPESYFHELREALGNTLHLCTVHAPDGEIAAGGLFTLVNGIAQDHLTGTQAKYLSLAPSKLMTYSKVIWLKSAGGTVFHLGGGVSSRADSLFYFKAGFSKLRSTFSTCSAIIDEARYTRLVDAARARIGQRESYFFPEYR